MSSKLEKYKKDFNNTCIEFLDQLFILTKNYDLLTYKDFFNKYVINGKKTEIAIELFCIHVLKYKTYINESNEDFFLKIDIKDKNKEYGGNEKSLMKIFELKNEWETFNCENKKIIFEYMQVLVYCAEKYFNIWSEKK